MTHNMGMIDRLLRTAIALAITAGYFGGYISGTVALLLGIVAVAFLVTSLIGWCRTYVPLGFSTRKRTTS